MAKWQPLQFVGGAYRDDSRPWSAQDCVNYLPVRAEMPGTRSMQKLVGVPGLNPFTAGMQAAPVRGLHDVEGLLLAVTGGTLYRIRPNGIAIPIGAIPGVGRVSMAHNQIANGFEVMIATGQSGYVYNTATDMLAQVTDEGFPGMLSADYVDGYIAGVDPQGRFWFHSELRQATQYNTLDRYDAESAPDRLLSLVVSHREVLVLGTRTGQFYRNTGAATGTFQNANGMEIDVGVANPYCAARMDNTVYWLGNDGLVYRLEGHSPVIVSTGPISDAMARLDLSRAYAMVWEDRKHKVFYLTFPDGQTWGYDAWSQEWHRRQSYGMERWRVSALCQSNGVWYAGDYTNGRLYRLDWDLQAEADDPLVRRRVTGAIHADQNEVLVNGVELVLDTGKPTVAAAPFPGQPEGPSISGEAPDGLSSDAYSFSYTVTAGDAPISRTVLRDTTLPDGWSWNEATATISHAGTPVPAATISLSMRVYDTNGLYADHDDEFMVVQKYQLIITGSAMTTGGPMYASAVAIDPMEFEGIAQSGGANLLGIPASYGGVTVVAGAKDARVSTDLTTWTTIPNALNTLRGLVGGAGGWLFVGDGGTSAYHRTGVAAHPPTAFEEYVFASEHPPGTPLREHGEGIYDSAYSGGYYWMDSGARGELIKTDVLSGSPLQAVCHRPDGIAGFFDVVEWGGALYAACQSAAIGFTYQIRRSIDGGATWPDVILDEPSTAIRPFQLACNDDVLVCLSSLSQWLWTSEDSFATPRSTGVNVGPAGTGRQIVAAAGRFYIIGRVGTDNSNCVCVSTVDGLTFSDPVSLPISAARGIAAGAVE